MNALIAVLLVLVLLAVVGVAVLLLRGQRRGLASRQAEPARASLDPADLEHLRQQERIDNVAGHFDVFDVRCGHGEPLSGDASLPVTFHTRSQFGLRGGHV